jgi:hypothetical protein
LCYDNASAHGPGHVVHVIQHPLPPPSYQTKTCDREDVSVTRCEKEKEREREREREREKEKEREKRERVKASALNLEF